MIVLVINSEVDFWQFNVSTTTHPTTYTHTLSHKSLLDAYFYF